MEHCSHVKCPLRLETSKREQDYPAVDPPHRRSLVRPKQRCCCGIWQQEGQLRLVHVVDVFDYILIANFDQGGEQRGLVAHDQDATPQKP